MIKQRLDLRIILVEQSTGYRHKRRHSFNIERVGSRITPMKIQVLFCSLDHEGLLARHHSSSWATLLEVIPAEVTPKAGPAILGLPRGWCWRGSSRPVSERLQTPRG